MRKHSQVGAPSCRHVAMGESDCVVGGMSFVSGSASRIIWRNMMEKSFSVQHSSVNSGRCIPIRSSSGPCYRLAAKCEETVFQLCLGSCSNGHRRQTLARSMKPVHALTFLFAWLVCLVGSVQGQTIEELLAQTPQCAVREASALPS